MSDRTFGTHAELTKHPRSSSALLIAFICAFLGFSLAPMNPAAQAATNVRLDKGHVDIFNVSAKGDQLKLDVKEDVTGLGVRRPAEDVTLVVKPQAFSTLPQNIPEIGVPGYYLPQTQDPALLWPGWDTLEVANAGFNAVKLQFIEVNGPGRIFLASSGVWGNVMPLLDGNNYQVKTGAVRTQAYPAHTHAHWIFEKPGRYTMKLQAIAAKNGKTFRSNLATYNWEVGDLSKLPKPVPAKPAPAPAKPAPVKPAPVKPVPAPAPAPAPAPTKPTPAPAPVKPTPAPAQPAPAKPAPAPSVESSPEDGQIPPRVEVPTPEPTTEATVEEPGAVPVDVTPEEVASVEPTPSAPTAEAPQKPVAPTPEAANTPESTPEATSPEETPAPQPPVANDPQEEAPAQPTPVQPATPVKPGGNSVTPGVNQPVAPAPAPKRPNAKTPTPISSLRQNYQQPQPVVCRPYQSASSQVSLAARVKDDRTSPAVWRDPAGVVFHLGDASRSRTNSPIGIIPANTPVWMIGATQIPNVPWLGANTMDESILNQTTGEVTWALTGFSGPGAMEVFTSGNFGKVVGQRWFAASGSRFGGSTVIGRNTHVHPNWVFTAPGTYRLEISQIATLRNGKKIVARTPLTFTVGSGSGITAGHFDLGAQVVSNGQTQVLWRDQYGRSCQPTRKITKQEAQKLPAVPDSFRSGKGVDPSQVTVGPNGQPVLANTGASSVEYAVFALGLGLLGMGLVVQASRRRQR
ncbi:hypothetical protein BK816_01480 [Boudabousia tangfeifanii]|uniref:Surface-anchored protein n=1 Tax=Boudabousia tangfeifanii TaxID=1912795 RepID=A0A1D9MIW5_9ACTO|nr:TIGR03773 family transporter-associated surface protein [Boudabousia tangfeifanii]AOZ72129.1 hypothetical protein BK816_01480 [Boudabousia tangfeifanii]